MTTSESTCAYWAAAAENLVLADTTRITLRPVGPEDRGALAGRREAFLAVQQPRGDLWDVLFDGPLTLDTLARVTARVHVIEGSQTSAVDHAICDIVRRHMPHAQHTLIEGAGHMMPLTHPEPLTRALLTGIER